MAEEEYVELTVRLPKRIMKLFEAYWKFVGYTGETAKEYLTKHVSKDLPELVFTSVFDFIRDDIECIIETYGLEPYRKAIGVPRGVKEA